MRSRYRGSAQALVFLLASWLLVGCAGTEWRLTSASAPSESSAGYAGAGSVVASTLPDPAKLPNLGFMFKRASEDAAGSSTPAPTDRLLVYTAQLAVEVASREDATHECVTQAKQLGGFLSARHSSAMTFRIPAAQFETFLTAVRSLGRVLDESMQVADVTKAHRDTAIRLDNAKQARARLIKLLENAEKVEDVLAIEREITRLTEVIEQADAELRSLDDRIALSTVTVSLQTPSSSIEPVVDGGSRSSFRWLHEIGVPEVMRCF